jgi:hypothetical protein
VSSKIFPGEFDFTRLVFYATATLYTEKLAKCFNFAKRFLGEVCLLERIQDWVNIVRLLVDLPTDNCYGMQSLLWLVGNGEVTYQNQQQMKMPGYRTVQGLKAFKAPGRKAPSNLFRHRMVSRLLRPAILIAVVQEEGEAD